MSEREGAGELGELGELGEWKLVEIIDAVSEMRSVNVSARVAKQNIVVKVQMHQSELDVSLCKFFVSLAGSIISLHLLPWCSLETLAMVFSELCKWKLVEDLLPITT